MMTLQLISTLLFLSSSVFGWMEPTAPWQSRILQRQSKVSLGMEKVESNPCWQDLYDEDCAMETIFSARYVASDWIKKLPCAKGMEVSSKHDQGTESSS
jgi:hypothetical protein